MIELETYFLNENGVGIDGDSITMEIEKNWLLTEIAPMSLETFLDTYTWDDSLELYLLYKKEGA